MVNRGLFSLILVIGGKIMKNDSLSEFIDRKIRDTMVKCLLEKLYDEIRITDLTNQAQINRTTFYLFYQSKEELVKIICDEYIYQYCQSLKESLQTRNLNYASAIYYFEKLPSKKDLLEILFSLSLKNYTPDLVMQKEIERVVTEIFSQKYPRVSPYRIDYFSKNFASNTLVTIKWWLENQQDCSVEVVVDMINQIMTQGLETILLDI